MAWARPAKIPEAIRKGTEDAKKNMHKGPLKGTTIPHEIIGEFGAGRVLLKPAARRYRRYRRRRVRAVWRLRHQGHPYQVPAFQQPHNVVTATIEGLKACARGRGGRADARQDREEILG